MEEKRKLEKVLLADIDAALENYQADRSTGRNKVEDLAKKNPPPGAKALLLYYLRAAVRFLLDTNGTTLLDSRRVLDLHRIRKWTRLG